MTYVTIRHNRRASVPSGYNSPCPICKAPAWHRCAAASGERRWKMHPERDAPDLHREPLPDLRGWWRSVAQYEGQYAKKRPDGLVVP